MSKSINIIKKEGEIQNKNFINTRLEAIYSLLANGEHTLSIKKKTNRRTPNQNSIMWLWYTCLAMETGSDKDEFHDYYCSKFLIRAVTITGIERRVVGGTRGLDVIAMTHFLNQVQADAATEFGVKLPTPQDLYWQEFENEYKRFMY